MKLRAITNSIGGACRRHLLVAAVVALCLAGAAASGELVRQHAGVTDGLLTRICRAAGGSGCSGALASRWSEITVPVPIPTRDLSKLVRRVDVPVAFLGLAYFVFMGTWFGLLGAPRRFGRPWHRIPLRVGYCGLVFSAVFVGIMAVGASPWCLACLTVHTINVLLVTAVWRLTCRPVPAIDPRPSAPEDLARLTLTSREVLVTIAVTLALVAGLWFYRRESLDDRAERTRLEVYETLVTSMQNDPGFLRDRYLAEPRYDIPLRESANDDRGLPRLVIFTDFQCPACYCNSKTLDRDIVDHFSGRLDVQVRHFPLCSDCNEHVEGTIHPEACQAAYAVEAARLQGGAPAARRMHDALFARRGRLDGEVYRELAAQIDLDPARLATDMAADELARIVREDIALARRIGVTGTPAMFLDGRQVPELCLTPAFWRMYADAHADPDSPAVADAVASEIEP